MRGRRRGSHPAKNGSQPFADGRWPDLRECGIRHEGRTPEIRCDGRVNGWGNREPTFESPRFQPTRCDAAWRLGAPTCHSERSRCCRRNGLACDQLAVTGDDTGQCPAELRHAGGDPRYRSCPGIMALRAQGRSRSIGHVSIWRGAKTRSMAALCCGEG